MPAALGASRNRKLALAFLVALATLALLAPVAAADFFTPEDGGSKNADEIDSLYKLVLVIAAIVFFGVEAALIYMLVRYRARKGAVPAQIRGNTRLEIAWTAIPAAVLVALSLVTFIKLDDIRNPPDSDANAIVADAKRRLPPSGKSLNICVNGQQYLWRYTYARDCKNAPLDSVFSYEEMVVPAGTTVTLDINSQDVAHSWWIPKLGGKMDAVPGYTNHTWFKVPADKAGSVFSGQCAELCGRNHANMTARVRAVTPPEFEAWVAGRKRDIKAANEAARKQREQFEGGEE